MMGMYMSGLLMSSLGGWKEVEEPPLTEVEWEIWRDQGLWRHGKRTRRSLRET